MNRVAQPAKLPASVVTIASGASSASELVHHRAQVQRALVIRHRALRLAQRTQLLRPLRPGSPAPAPSPPPPRRIGSGRRRCPAPGGTRGRFLRRRDAPARSARCPPCRARCSPASPRRRAGCRSPGSGPPLSPCRSGRDRTRRRGRRRNCPPCRRTAPGGGNRPSPESRCRAGNRWIAARPASVQQEPPSTATGRRDRASIARNCSSAAGSG